VQGKLFHPELQTTSTEVWIRLLQIRSTVEQLCQQTGAEIANNNSGGQIVISGAREAIIRAIDLSRIMGARKAIPLVVSGAFHSSLMQEAKEGLSEALVSMDFQDPGAPIIANSDCAELRTGEQVREELVRGLCQCVQWRNTVRCMVDSGITQFVELGPASVLAGLIKRIDRGVEAVALSNPESIRKLAGATT